MAMLPQKPDREILLAQWFKRAEELKKIKAEEMVMRKTVVKAFFPNAKEGTNKVELSDGYVLEMSQPIERKIDEAAMDALTPEDWEKVNISKDVMVAYKPSLKVSSYRTLTDEQLAVFDQLLIIKPGTPSGMKVSAPKEPK